MRRTNLRLKGAGGGPSRNARRRVSSPSGKGAASICPPMRSRTFSRKGAIGGASLLGLPSPPRPAILPKPWPLPRAWSSGSARRRCAPAAIPISACHSSCPTFRARPGLCSRLVSRGRARRGVQCDGPAADPPRPALEGRAAPQAGHDIARLERLCSPHPAKIRSAQVHSCELPRALMRPLVWRRASD